MSQPFELPAVCRAHGTAMWSDDRVQEAMRKAGVSLDDRGVPKHPFQIWRRPDLGPDWFEVRQGERA